MGLLEKLEERARQKRRRAQQSYVKQTQAKLTENCKHAGKRITGGIRHCKIAAMGGIESDALSCHDQKACYCPVFQPSVTTVEAKEDFSSMGIEELSLRWPSLGECIRILDMVRKDELISGTSGRSRNHPTKEGSKNRTVNVSVGKLDGFGDGIEENQNGEEDNGGNDEESSGDSVKENAPVSLATVR